MKSRLNHAISIWIAAGLITGVQAQSFDASSMAMGGAYGGVARGVDALAWNPANLALSRVHAVELNFIGLNLAVANSSFSLKNYERYFTESGHKGIWSEKDKDAILDLIPDWGLQTSVDADANVMGLAVLSYGLSAEVIGNGLGLIPKAPAALYIHGNEKDQYNFSGTALNGFSALKISLSAAQKIPFKMYCDEFSVGLALNYYLGVAAAEVQKAEGAFFTGPEYVYLYSDIRGRRATGIDSTDGKLFGGRGFGLDIGTAGIINQKFSFSLVLKNLFAGLKWDSGTEAFMFSMAKDSLRLDKIDDFDPQTIDTSYTIGSFRTYLPVVMHLGLAYRLKENLLFSLDVEQAFENKMGYTDQAKLAVGTEYRPLGWMPLRAGLSFGGKWGGYSLGLGFGLHAYVFEFDIAYLMQHALWPTYSDGVALAMNMKFLL